MGFFIIGIILAVATVVCLINALGKGTVYVVPQGSTPLITTGK